MSTPRAAVSVSTPGRVCLFGEHQDYLGLPVIPCAISLRIRIDARPRDDRTVRIDMPDIGAAEQFSLDGPLAYVRERDYLRSAVNVIRREGYTFSRGFDCTVRGTIPINAGTSSSSALVVSWVNLLAAVSDQGTALPPADCARLAHSAEVLEFHEPGGMMDHCAAAYGGVTVIDFGPAFSIAPLDVDLGSFVLGDSGEPKDTKGILARVKGGVLEAVEFLRRRNPGFSLMDAAAGSIRGSGSGLPADREELLEGTLRNRDITGEARELLRGDPVDRRRLGALLTDHHAVLRDVLGISTKRIDAMLAAAAAAGAFGGKINGSGGGGCMFAYAPENPGAVAEAIASAGPYIISADAGTRRETPR